MAANLNPPSPIPAALGALAEHKQFIIWRQEPNPNGGKPIKRPLNPETLQHANALDPAMWLLAEHAYQSVAFINEGVTSINGDDFYGVGFVLTEPDPFFCLDIDQCDSKSSESGWSALALDLTKRLPGAAVEVSHSGRGLHIWGTARPMPFHRCRNAQHPIELYSDNRFIALGRPDANGDIRTDCTAALVSIVGDYFSNGSEATGQGEIAWTTAPCEKWEGDIDDDELIRAALDALPTAGAMFDNDVTFRDLWEANADALGKKWPHPTNVYDMSAADASLAQRLAWRTGNDCERIKKLMCRSKLARGKWERADYLQGTIRYAVSQQTKVYDRKFHSKPQGADLANVGDLAAGSVIAPSVEHKVFRGRKDHNACLSALTAMQIEVRANLRKRGRMEVNEAGRGWSDFPIGM